MAVDIQKLFNHDLPDKLAKHPDAAKQIGAKFQINITGAGGGSWFVDVSDSGPFSEAGVKPADCAITVSAEDFQMLYENPQANGAQLFFAGKLKADGNPMLAMKLSTLFTLD